MGQSDILLVGDGFALLYPLSKALECEGFSVCLTEMWEEALQALSRNLFDLVIVKLPFQRTTDSHIFKLIKKVNSSAKLIVLSGSEQLPIEVFEIEVDDYIILPCRPAEIGRRILACLNHGKSSSEAEQTQARLNAINTKVLYKLGLMFHDIRGSLVSIDAGMKLLKRRANGKVERDYMQLLKDIQWKTKKLLNLTDVFLNSTFRSQEYTEIEVVRDLIDPVLEEFRKDLRQRQLAVDIHLNVDSLRGISVIGNKVVLQSVFRNLIHNAIKNGKKKGLISIELEHSGSELLIRVQNDGSAISEEYHRQIFTPFSPLAKKKNGKQKGLGLGLYLIREILQCQGGDICYKTHPDGSTFIVTIPCS